MLLSFIGASLILIIMPGPDNIFVLTQSLSQGRKTGVAISTGLSCGIIVHTLAAATGLSLIIQKSAMVFSIVKYLGAAYLLYMAIMAAKEKRPHIELKVRKSDGVQTPFFTLWRKGFLMNILNPKVSLFFIAFLPQFVTTSEEHYMVQMIILGAIFMAFSWLVFSLIATVSGKLTHKLNSPKFWKITKWTKVGVLSTLGISLAISGR